MHRIFSTVHDHVKPVENRWIEWVTLAKLSGIMYPCVITNIWPPSEHTSRKNAAEPAFTASASACKPRTDGKYSRAAAARVARPLPSRPKASARAVNRIKWAGINPCPFSICYPNRNVSAGPRILPCYPKKAGLFTARSIHYDCAKVRIRQKSAL